jgi:hypothetical protein
LKKRKGIKKVRKYRRRIGFYKFQGRERHKYKNRKLKEEMVQRKFGERDVKTENEVEEVEVAIAMGRSTVYGGGGG